jgi:nitrogen fixation NifU-like protein
MTDARPAAPRAGVTDGLEPGPGNGPGAARRGALPYSDVIRERWRRPRFRGALDGPDAVAEDVNPLCGDRVRFMLRLADGRVGTARFLGDSCAICTASADVLAEAVEGRPVDEARSVKVDDLLEVLAADIRPTRMRCVTLPLTVLGAALGRTS